MSARWFGIIFLAAAFHTFAAAALAGGDGGIEEGKRLAETLCARCHAIGLEDRSRDPEALPFRDFYTKWPLENLEESLAEGIDVGHPGMPAFELHPDQIDDLIAYLYTLE